MRTSMIGGGTPTADGTRGRRYVAVVEELDPPLGTGHLPQLRGHAGRRLPEQGVVAGLERRRHGGGRHRELGGDGPTLVLEGLPGQRGGGWLVAAVGGVQRPPAGQGLFVRLVVEAHPEVGRPLEVRLRLAGAEQRPGGQQRAVHRVPTVPASAASS